MQYFLNAIHSGDIGTIRAVIQQHRSSRTSIDFERLLSTAYDFNKLDIARELLESQVADPNTLSSIYGPLLFRTIWDNQPRYTNLLLENGADPNQGDGNGVTPLMLACTSADIRLVKKLLAKNANVNQISWSGADALYNLVSTSGDLEQRMAIAELLLERGANPHSSNNYHSTSHEYMIRLGYPL
jgi:uncharacterized protein